LDLIVPVWQDVTMPEPGPGQIRIRVMAAGVSPTDPKSAALGANGQLSKLIMLGKAATGARIAATERQASRP
jgi:NADPH:quinone reductase-like Zn-dependent oxidoreductase